MWEQTDDALTKREPKWVTCHMCSLALVHCFTCKCTSSFTIQFLNGHLAEVDMPDYDDSGYLYPDEQITVIVTEICPCQRQWDQALHPHGGKYHGLILLYMSILGKCWRKKVELESCRQFNWHCRWWWFSFWQELELKMYSSARWGRRGCAAPWPSSTLARSPSGKSTIWQARCPPGEWWRMDDSLVNGGSGEKL